MSLEQLEHTHTQVQHNSHRGMENCSLAHYKTWRGSSWHRRRDLGWDSCVRCWQQRQPHVVAERTRASTLNCMRYRVILTPPLFCFRPRFVPALVLFPPLFCSRPCFVSAFVLFPPSNCTRVLVGTEINSTSGNKSRKCGTHTYL